MALSSGFFNGTDRKYDAIQISSLFDGLINDGVFSTIGNRFVVNVASANSVTIGTGRAWFKHTWTYNDAPYPVQMDAAEAILNRYDTLALEMDLVTGRTNGIKYIKGTPSSSAVEPLLIQNSSIYQVPLAVAYRKAGATTLTQADITQKVGTSSCPLVTAVNQSMTIDAIVAQWETEFDNWMVSEQNSFGKWRTTQQSAFTTWFDTIKNQLTTDAAGNLQTQINAVKSAVGSDYIVGYTTPPSYSGGTVTIYAGTKYACAEGIDANGYVKQTVRTLEASKTITLSDIGNYCIFVDDIKNLLSIRHETTLYVDNVSKLPTTVSDVYPFAAYVVNEHRYYLTTGSTTTNWIPKNYCKIASVRVVSSVITNFKPNLQINLAQKIGKDKLLMTMADVQSNTDKEFVPSATAIKEISNYIVQSRHSLPESSDIVESWWFDKWYDGHCTANLVLKTAFEPGIAWTPGQYHLSSVFSLPFPLKHVRAVGIHQNEDMLGMHVGTRWFKDANSVSKRMQFYINNSNNSAIPLASAGVWVIAIEGIWRELVNGQWVEVTGGA